jgi:hypothetical protein
VEIHDFFLNQKVVCVLGISADSFVLLEASSGGSVIFATPIHSILGWANTDLGLA